MRVRAHQTGYYGLCLRHPGHIFRIKSEKEFSPEWMEYVDEAEAGKKGASKSEPGQRRGMKPAPRSQDYLDAKIARVDAIVEDEAEREADGKDVI